MNMQIICLGKSNEMKEISRKYEKLDNLAKIIKKIQYLKKVSVL